MKAVIKKGYEDHMLEYTDIPKPEVGPGDVLIRVKAAGICGSDLPLYYGKVEGKTVDYPIVIGHEFAGEVCRVGEGVEAWKIGDRVVSDNTGYVCGKCYACGSGEYLFCAHRKGMGNDMDGGFAEYVKIPAQVLNAFPNCLYQIPENVSYEHAAILDPCCNAYKAIIQEAQMLPGQTIVVFGAGALGLFCVQIAQIAGAGRIIVVGMKEDQEVRFSRAKELGATDFIVADGENVVERARALAGEEGVAVVVDCAGAPVVLQQSIELIRNGGKIVKIGYSKNPIGFSLDNMALKGVTLIGHMGYNSTSWKNCIELLTQGRVRMDSIISHRMPLSQWEQGIEMVKARIATKVILVPGEV
jgi:2-desacetyl-2-hydroxyethyl bacteriochlorophyllide A dehydrogenase